MKEYQDWLNMLDEEKVKGDLWLWKFRFKKDQGTEPTAEQIEAKKQELISKLPTPDEMRKRTFGGYIDGLSPHDPGQDRALSSVPEECPASG